MAQFPRYSDISEQRTKRIADVRYGDVVQRNSDGTYDVRLLTSQQTVRATKANPQDEFSAGTRVVLSNLSASRLAVGGGWVIISRAPQEQKGLTGLARANQLIQRSTVILGVDPSPVVLEQGGAAVSATIYGKNMTLAPSSYGTSEISDDTAPVISNEEVTIDIVASASAPLGNHGLTIHGVTIPDAIQVVEGEDNPVLWITYGRRDTSGTVDTPGMCALDVATLTVTRGPFTGNSIGSAQAAASNPIIIGANAYCLFIHAGTNQVSRLEAPIASGAGSYTALGANESHVGAGSQLIDDGTGILHLGANATWGTGLNRAPLSGTGVTQLYATSRYGRGVYGDGSHYYLAPVGSVHSASRINAALDTEEAIAISVEVVQAIGNDDYVFMRQFASGGSIYRVAKSGLAVTSLAYASGHTPYAMVLHGNYLFVLVYQTTTKAYIDKIDISTMTSVDTLEWTYAALGSNFPNLMIQRNGRAWIFKRPISGAVAQLAIVNLDTMTEIAAFANVTDFPEVAAGVTFISPQGICIES